MDGQMHAGRARTIEVRMRRREGVGFTLRCLAEAVDIVMTVALHVMEAEPGAQRQILLQGQARLAGQVLAGDEEPSARGIPLGVARGVEDRLVDALAGFGGDAAVAELARSRKGIIAVVRLV